MGRFASPDPARDQHFEDTQSWNIYSYVRNRPIMSTDPTGMLELAVYAQQSADADLTGMYEGFNEAGAAVAEKELEDQIPNEAKSAIKASIDASNRRTSDDGRGGYHEEGGMWGRDAQGNVVVSELKPGAVAVAGGESVSIDYSEHKDMSKLEKMYDFEGKWHVHPQGGGDIEFRQPPSGGPGAKNKGDLDSSDMYKFNIVVGAASQKVYFYDKDKIIREVSFSQFFRSLNGGGTK